MGGLDVLREAIVSAPPVANFIGEAPPPPKPDPTINRGAATNAESRKFQIQNAAAMTRHYGELRNRPEVIREEVYQVRLKQWSSSPYPRPVRPER